jgi:hypothetical protein
MRRAAPFFMNTHAKAAKVSLDGSPLRYVCVDGFCIERDLERSLHCLAMGRTACTRLRCVASMSGPTIPDARNALTSDNADQAALLS